MEGPCGILHSETWQELDVKIVTKANFNQEHHERIFWSNYALEPYPQSLAGESSVFPDSLGCLEAQITKKTSRNETIICVTLQWSPILCLFQLNGGWGFVFDPGAQHTAHKYTQVSICDAIQIIFIKVRLGV